MIVLIVAAGIILGMKLGHIEAELKHFEGLPARLGSLETAIIRMTNDVLKLHSNGSTKERAESVTMKSRDDMTLKQENPHEDKP